MATGNEPKGMLVGWVLVSRWKGEPWTLVSSNLLTHEDIAKEKRLHEAGASANRQYMRARVVLED